MAWHAKELVRSIYQITDCDLAEEFVDQLADDLQDDSCPPEVNSLGRTITRWRDQITAWHRCPSHQRAHPSTNNPIKQIQRIGFPVPPVQQLPHPGPPLRRQTQLVPTPHCHTPLKSNEPSNGNWTDTRSRDEAPLVTSRFGSIRALDGRPTTPWASRNNRPLCSRRLVSSGE